MRKATATYHAPEGDNKVVEMGGVTFFDGQEVEINTEEHPHLISVLENNQHFEFELGEDDGEKRKRGRPPKNRDLAEGVAEGRDHDFEKDRRDNLSKGDTIREGEPVVIKPAKGQGSEGPAGFTGSSAKPADENAV